MSYYRGAWSLLPEGVLSQWLHQEPEAARPFLQYAGRVSVQRHVGKLPGGKDGKGGLLAHARGPGQPRHDRWEARLDGSGGEPDRSIHANADGRFQPGQPYRQYVQEHRYLYGSVHDGR